MVSFVWVAPLLLHRRVNFGLRPQHLIQRNRGIDRFAMKVLNGFHGFAEFFPGLFQVDFFLVLRAIGQDTDAIRRDFARLFEQERAVAASREHRAEGRSTLAIGAGLGGFALLLILAAGFSLFLRRFVVRPVKEVAGASGKLAAGKRHVAVGQDRRDRDLAGVDRTAAAEAHDRIRLKPAQFLGEAAHGLHRHVLGNAFEDAGAAGTERIGHLIEQ